MKLFSLTRFKSWSAGEDHVFPERERDQVQHELLLETQPQTRIHTSLGICGILRYAPGRERAKA